MKEGAGAGAARLAPVLLAVVLGLFFLPALTGSGQFLSRDSGSLHHPMKAWVASRWAEGRVPEWNPFSGLGIPEIAGAVDAVLHPFNLLLVAMPFEAGFKAWVLLSYLAAALGAFAWARALGCGGPAALVGALAYSLSGHLVGSSDNLTFLTTLAFVPWVFATGHRFLVEGSPSALAATGLASAATAAGGDPQAWGFAVLLLVPYLFGVAPAAGAAPRPLRALLAAAVAVVAAAPVILPVILWLPHSSRSAAVDAVRLSHWDLLPRRLLELLVPNLVRTAPGTMVSPAFDAFTSGGRAGLPWVASIYVGTTTLLLAGAGAFLSRPARRLLLGAALFTWMACGAHLGFARLAAHLPVLGSFRYWEKLFAWPTLFLAMAAALGLDAILRADLRVVRRFAAVAGALGVILLAVRAGAGAAGETLLPLLGGGDPSRAAGAAELLQNALDGLVSSGLAATLLAAAAAASTLPRLARLGPALLVVAAVADPFSANGHAYVLVAADVANPPAPLGAWARAQDHRVRIFGPYEITSGRWPERTQVESGWLWAARTLRPSWNVRYGVGNLDPYSGMLPSRLSSLRFDLRAADLVRSVGTWGVEALVVPRSPDLAGMLELPGPYDVLASDPELPAYLVALRSRPRAYLASDVSSVAPDRSRDAALALDPGARTAIVESPIPGPASSGGRVAISVDDPEQVVLEVEASAPGLVVLSDQDAPGWTALVDGAATPIVTANHLARGVWVGAGRHAVEFRYRTPGFRTGLSLAALLFTGLLAWAVIARRGRTPPGRGGSRTCTE